MYLGRENMDAVCLITEAFQFGYIVAYNEGFLATLPPPFANLGDFHT